MEPLFPPDFLKLPGEEQRKIKTVMRQTAQLAYDRTAPIIISSPPKARDKGALRSASGFYLRLDDQNFLGTAAHVWDYFIERREAGENVIFQSRGFAIDPSNRFVWRDDVSDLVLIAVSDKEVKRSGQVVSSAVYGWPPPRPTLSSFVLFSGCPETHRSFAADHHIEFGSFSSVMQVTSVGSDHLVCQFQRGTWIWEGQEPPPDEGANLSGMSGGPVFGLENMGIPLIGLISEFHRSWELLRVTLFAGLSGPPTSTTRVA